MVAKLGLILAAPFLLLAMMVGASGVVVVDVNEGGVDGTHLMIPVPLALAQTALTFAPDEMKYIDCPEFAPYQDVAERILEELKDTPDFTLVEVRERDTHVLVKKEGDHLRVEVYEANETEVSCLLPINGALKVIRSYDGERFPAKAAIWGMRKAKRGTLVHVKDGGDEVKIRLL